MRLPKIQKDFGQGGLAAVHTQTTFAFSRCKYLELLSANNTNSCAFTPWQVWPISYSGVTVDVSVMSLKYQSPSPLECWTPLCSAHLCGFSVHSDVSQYVSPWNVEPSLHLRYWEALQSLRVSKQDRTPRLCWWYVRTETLEKFTYMQFTKESLGCKRSRQLHNHCCLVGKLHLMLIVKECKECPVTVTSICSDPSENLTKIGNRFVKASLKWSNLERLCGFSILTD